MDESELKGAIEAWAWWKSSGNGYPSMDTIGRAIHLGVGDRGSFGSRIPKSTEVPYHVGYVIEGLDWLSKTQVGRIHFAAIHIQYLYSNRPERERITTFSEVLRNNGMINEKAQDLSRAKYYERVARAREALLDFIQRNQEQIC